MSEHVRDEKVLEPYLYLGQILGKNVRGVLIDCFQEWIAIPEEKMEIIKVSPSLPVHCIRSKLPMTSTYIHLHIKAAFQAITSLQLIAALFSRANLVFITNIC